MLKQCILSLIIVLVAFFTREIESAVARLKGVSYDISKVKNDEMVDRDFKAMKQYGFDLVRLYEWKDHVSLADLALKNGLQIIFSINLQNIEQGCAIVNSKGAAFNTICMGNENMQDRSLTIPIMGSHIDAVKKCLNQNMKYLKLALCERMTEFIQIDLSPLQPKVDYMLASIHPFFSSEVLTSAAADLKLELDSVHNKYGALQVGLSETGYTTSGQPAVKNPPSLDMMCKLFTYYKQLAAENPGQAPYVYFMFKDVDYKSTEAENSFGLQYLNGTDKCPVCTVP
ncbi:hypothetical protein ABG067_004945 [Albugo candida]